MKLKKIILLTLALTYLLTAKLYATTLKEQVFFKGTCPVGYSLIPASVVPSPDLKHIGFVCISKDKEKMIAVVDGKKNN